MSPPARKSVATKELLRQVVGSATGRLSIDSLDGPIELYLMSGDVVGAVTPDDDRRLLERLRRTPQVTGEQLGRIDRLANAQGVFAALLDVLPTDVIEPMLEDRFRENLVQWVVQTEQPTFEPLPGVFVDNMQMGHNTIQLIESVCKIAADAHTCPPDTEVVRGTGTTSDAVESSVLALCGDAPVSVANLLAQLPLEPLMARATIARLLAEGMLVEAGLDLIDGSPAAPDEEEPDDAPTVVVRNELTAGLQQPAPAPEEDDPSDEGPVTPVSPGTDLSKWLHTGDLDEEDMAFFEDHEDDRGAGQGGFSTESHNLDKVEVLPPAAAAEEEPIAVDDGGARYAAPVLSEDTAVHKITVGNEVMAAVCAAFDAEQGPGRGQAAIQLLVDGSPARFATLLHGLSVQTDGTLDPESVLDNLAGRPATEHRQLLHSAMKDLIDRALSSAADELDDDAFDTLYEGIAGFNQRLGI